MLWSSHLLKCIVQWKKKTQVCSFMNRGQVESGIGSVMVKVRVEIQLGLYKERGTENIGGEKNKLSKMGYQSEPMRTNEQEQVLLASPRYKEMSSCCRPRKKVVGLFPVPGGLSLLPVSARFSPGSPVPSHNPKTCTFVGLSFCESL